ncbi:MAG: MBL fold metallo-hydrolase [Clostridia bacterium]|nr:MBL fold metallo-hydrolase [Clostridia bacterium]MBO5913168.1 MBL fold metallo-hydrolase [Clostridia bacterium]
MKITFLGTGAADWSPKKPETGEHRWLSSALINDDLLIDPGPCVLDAIEKFKIDAQKIKYIIVTHRHGDHFNEETLKSLCGLGAELVEFSAEDEKKVGKYTVKAVPANHPTCVPTVHFFIDDGEKRIFYGLDGAWLLMSEVDAIKEKHVDLAVLDATIGNRPGDYRIFEHNNLKMVVEMKETLSKYIDRFVISHMARTLHDPHDVLAAEMQKENIETAFDGLVLEI